MTMIATTTTPAAPKHVNGLDPNAIHAAAQGLAENPALAAVAFRAATSWKGGLRTSTAIQGYQLAGQPIARRHRIDTDEPSELFGQDSAPNPQDLLLAALNACMTVGFVVGATARGITLEALQIESELALDLRGAFGIDPSVPAGADSIAYTIRVKARASKEELEEVHREVIANSPNRYHLSRPVALTSQLLIE